MHARRQGQWSFSRSDAGERCRREPRTSGGVAPCFGHGFERDLLGAKSSLRASPCISKAHAPPDYLSRPSASTSSESAEPPRIVSEMSSAMVSSDTSSVLKPRRSESSGL